MKRFGVMLVIIGFTFIAMVGRKNSARYYSHSTPEIYSYIKDLSSRRGLTFYGPRLSNKSIHFTSSQQLIKQDSDQHLCFVEPSRFGKFIGMRDAQENI